MRSASVVGTALALLLIPEVAAAQNATTGKTPSGPARSSSQFTLRREEAGGPDAQIARSRARAGDCAGALSAFDAAVRVTIDPTLRRDRGLCHDKLNHPFPAIDDYRAYLTARPDAPDSEQIRHRLAELEEQTGVGGPSAESIKESDDGGGDGFEASGSVSVGSGGAKAEGKSSGRTKVSASGKSYDDLAAEEKKADLADESPLRNGEGIIIGAFLHLPRYFIGEGTTSDMGYGVGGLLRWSTGPMVSLVSEFGYAGVGTQGANTSSGGPLLMGGVELRLPITRFAADQVLLKGGAGYERYTTSGTRLSSNILLGRFAVGFRHVFGPSLGFEILFDGGPAYVLPENGLDGRLIGLVAASAALTVAF